MRTTIGINDDLLKQARKRAANEGRILTSLVEEGLVIILSKTKAAEQAGFAHLLGRSMATTKCDSMRDFFISYAEPKRTWSEWIVRHVREAGYATIQQGWTRVPFPKFLAKEDRS